MAEMRQNLITRDWVIIATERARRPHEFSRTETHAPHIPTYRPDCPFCPGNESTTELETFCLRDRRGWRVRTFQNRYPALTPEGDRVRHINGVHRSMPAVGTHEVLVEHPRHDLTTALMSVEDVANILRAYRQRYYEIRQDPRVEAIIIFKNHGVEAGTSMEHPHSQIAATPIVPYQFRIRIDEAIRYLDDTGECVFCRVLRDELKANRRLVVESHHFVAFVPYAAMSPFHTWIFPRRHASSFDSISDEEIIDLAYVLKMTLAKLYYGLNNPDYNYTIRSVPTDDQDTDYFHWYIAIVPRVSRSAGFELGSGIFINTSLPEESADYLRHVEVPAQTSHRS